MFSISYEEIKHPSDAFVLPIPFLYKKATEFLLLFLYKNR